MAIKDDLDIYIDEEPDLNQRITGFLGSFNTSDSYNVMYMLSNFTIKDFKLFEIASEAFNFDQVDFEEMVQRDVDTVRVYKDLIDEYLKKGKNRALFFPPLIVSLIAFDRYDKPVHQFKQIHEDNTEKKLIKRWDSYFAVEAFKADKDTGAYLKDQTGVEIPIHPYASRIHYDDRKVKLIVIDGQHRFFALRALSKNQPDLIKEIHLPVCIVFSPDAIEGSGGQDVMVNLRSMFVTINNKGKEVSGHFLDLLNDHSIASFCIRELAELWKETTGDSLTSKLQFLEWNQRDRSKSYQVNKRHAITTVSIIADVLRRYIFQKNRKECKTFNLLNLGSKKSELEIHPHSTSIYYITDQEFDIEQRTIIRDLVKENVVPCLNYLFLEPSVYKIIQDKYLNALKLLEERVDKGIEGWLTYKSLLKEFKETNKLSQEPAIIAEREFNKSIDIEKSIETYRKNVFQQGYIRAWAQIADSFAADYEIPPLISAKAVVAGFERLVFDSRKAVFDKDQPYTQLVLYDKSGKPNVTVRGKQAWFEILMAFFKEQDTLEQFLRTLKGEMGGSLSSSDSDKIRDQMGQWGLDSFRSFCGALQESIEKDFSANWRIKEFPKAFKDHLEQLLTEESPEKTEEFKKLIKEKADYSYSEAIDPLCGLLGVKKPILPSIGESASDEEMECLI
jgi:hypothetical protein